MDQPNTRSGEKETAEDEHSLRELVVTTLWVLGCVAFVLVIAAIWFFISYAVDPRLTDPVQFIGVNVLNTLIFVAIVAQVMIYRKQRDIMKAQADSAGRGVEIAEKQLIHDQRARIVVNSLTSPADSDDETLRLENKGKLAADPAEIFVDMIVIVPQALVTSANDTQEAFPLREAYDHAWYWSIPIVTGLDLDIPLSGELNGLERSLWRAGELRIIAQIQINHGDGFGQTETSKRAFRYDDGRWKDWPVWTAGTKEDRMAEEQSRYHPK